jgi:hypothetical protein
MRTSIISRAILRITDEKIFMHLSIAEEEEVISYA